MIMFKLKKNKIAKGQNNKFVECKGQIWDLSLFFIVLLCVSLKAHTHIFLSASADSFSANLTSYILGLFRLVSGVGGQFKLILFIIKIIQYLRVDLENRKNDCMFHENHSSAKNNYYVLIWSQFEWK